MLKRNNTYRLSLESLSLKDELAQSSTIKLAFENHDDIFIIIESLKEKNPFGDKNQAVEFAIGIKLFTEVMIRNRKHPLFEDFFSRGPDLYEKN
ncbi:putative protein DUF3861 [Leeuwenhoekiella aestuarii]|uniref:DUF3861 family protein n=1 Tax=Leeuwenhoekiella aestuarii TaxID=2249426 RepID=A0A4Q0NNG0_9FLAO|nr:DUF3861 family protein [Leeuwenhoekiella aestuarii]RXG11424.1 putative protein DUF3861 [Leeuwenhoekiella aestuarii]RXG12161.1 putative protein DUF3861 [Leeuwenhoekiella aestuarii]